MDLKKLLTLFSIITSLHLSAQTQSWQWVKAGGSSSDNNAFPTAALCKIGGCDAKGNVYAVGGVNGSNMQFDTFSSAGAYSVTGAGISYLLFSYDCAGRMRWAKQIGDEEGDYLLYDVTTDPQGNTYLATNFRYGINGGLVRLFLGDTIITPSQPMLTQKYLCMVKYDSLGRLVWFKNYENDTVYNNQHNYAFGLRIGSSGNLWMACELDSNYAISPNLHTTKKGKYNVEVSPATGAIMGGYYTCNGIYGDAYNPNVNWDIDEHENYYESGLVNMDTLRLANKSFAPDQNNTNIMPFIYSLDRHGNFRFIVLDTVNPTATSIGACKYSMQSHRLIATMTIDTFAVLGRDTFTFATNQLQNPASQGLLCIDTSGNVLWGKYITSGNPGSWFQNLPMANYVSIQSVDGSFVYAYMDTIKTGVGNCTSNCADFYRNIIQIDKDGNYIARHVAPMGVINQNAYGGGDAAASGATDWRGNLYVGGSITSYMSTPTDSVANTDAHSGNFFIAKIGISDCSCPTPGAQFTQVVKGDTVYFFGSSLNHRDSIHWRFGDGTFASLDSPVHVYAHDGTYTVTVVAYGNCGVDSISKQITVRNVGIAVVDPNETNLYPNPTKKWINLEVSAPARIGLVFANGASVWDSPMQVIQQGTYVFDMSRYSSGLYYFVVEYTSGKTDVLKVVKE